MEKQKEQSIKADRLVSIDALRGFTMFMLVAGGYILRALPEISDNSFFRMLYTQMEHVPWEGFRYYDLIFPMFLFIIGLTLPFSYKRRLESASGKGELYKHIFIRTIILFILGLICFGYSDPELKYDGEVIGYYGVLQLLAVGYFFASLIMLNTSVRGVAIWAGGIMIFYFLIMKFIPVPGYGAGDFTREGNFNEYISKLVAANIGIKWRILLSPYMIPTVSTALLGVLTGYWLQSDNSKEKKARGMLISAIVLLAAGLIWSIWFPIIKNLWTSSYVLFAGGLTMLNLVLFYWLIDILKYQKWAFFFVVVGTNAITIYMLTHVMNFDNISYFFIYGIRDTLGAAQSLVIALISASLQWLLLYYLYRNRYFIKL
jgi:predicted acyltransferase